MGDGYGGYGGVKPAPPPPGPGPCPPGSLCYEHRMQNQQMQQISRTSPVTPMESVRLSSSSRNSRARTSRGMSDSQISDTQARIIAEQNYKQTARSRKKDQNSEGITQQRTKRRGGRSGSLSSLLDSGPVDLSNIGGGYSNAVHGIMSKTMDNITQIGSRKEKKRKSR